MITLGGYQALDVAEKVEQYDGLDAAGQLAWLHPDFWAGKASSYRTGRGPDPGRGWLLLRRADLAALDAGSLHTLVLASDPDDPAQTVTVPNLVIVRTEAVTPGVAGDQDAAVLVEVADPRHLASNEYYGTPVNRQYNVRAPAGGSATYYADTLNGGSPWTWQQMLDSLWTAVGVAALGAAPTLPFTPHGTPEGFRFVGLPAWLAYNAVLERLCLTFHFDRDGAPQIVNDGDPSAAFDAATALHRDRLLFDNEGTETTRAKVPSSVRVYFHRCEFDYGTERTTPADTNQWATTPAVAVTVPAPATVTGTTGGIKALWDDLPALRNFGGTITNQAALNDRALERATDYYSSLVGGTLLRRSYAGTLDHAGLWPNSQVAGTCWRDLGGDGGLVTEIVRYTGSLRVTGDGTFAAGPDEEDAASALRTTDLQRHTLPLYPHLLQEVKVGHPVPTATKLYLGRVQRFDPATLAVTGGEECWLMGANGERFAFGFTYDARLWGSRTDTHVTGTFRLPIYRAACCHPGSLLTSSTGSATGSATASAYGSASSTGVDNPCSAYLLAQWLSLHEFIDGVSGPGVELVWDEATHSYIGTAPATGQTFTLTCTAFGWWLDVPGAGLVPVDLTTQFLVPIEGTPTTVTGLTFQVDDVNYTVLLFPVTVSHPGVTGVVGTVGGGLNFFP